MMLTDFIQAVNKALNEGWTLAGGMAVEVRYDGGLGGEGEVTYYYQAITREAKQNTTGESSPL